jgi:glyoxylase-like metal-dependent hydrolase (beta-lactamase superfamily II)
MTMLPSLRTLAAALLIVGAGGTIGVAMAQTPQTKLSQSQAGYYRMRLGDFEITALSDGTLPIPAASLLSNTQPGEVEQLLNNAFQTTSVDESVNAFLVKADGRLILVDAGTGLLFGPTLNKLEHSLGALGVSTGQITDILVTHIHTDHTGGLMDGARMVFPNATLHMDKRELAYWLDPENGRRAAPENKHFFDEALAKVKPYVDAGKVKAFDGTTQVFPGIRAIAAPGHTPGHSVYEVRSKGETLLFWGDLVHVADVQMPDPAVTIAFDVDPAQAALTRKRTFAEAAAGRYWIAGDHMTFPGIGHLARDGNAYRWVPAPYVNDAVRSADAR